MTSEFWFYFTTVLICIGYALLMQSYPQWKVYFSIGLVGFIIGGAVLVYFDAKEREEDRIKIGQMDRMLEDAKKEAKQQESLAKDATDRARLLSEQLETKTEEMAKVFKEKPQIGGEIVRVGIFPWQRDSASQKNRDVKATATGIVVFARVENHGSSTPLANWELTIKFPDNTVIKPQKWPVQKTMRIPCEDGPINISKDEYLDVETKQALQKTGERSGVLVWMLKDLPLNTIRTRGSFYTLTARDNIGVVHALERYTLDSLPQKCSGFDFSD